MKTKLTILLIALLTLGNSYSQNTGSNSLSIEEPKVEYHKNPEGLDVPKPRFSWILNGEGRSRSQSSYQIIVASSMDKLLDSQADVWDSGKVNTNHSNQIEFDGIPLVSDSKYYWKAKVWDESGNASEWSAPAHWSMGLLKFSNWKGLFIGHDVGYNKTDKYDSLYLPI